MRAGGHWIVGVMPRSLGADHEAPATDRRARIQVVLGATPLVIGGLLKGIAPPGVPVDEGDDPVSVPWPMRVATDTDPSCFSLDYDPGHVPGEEKTMSLLSKTADVMHRQHGWFVTDSFTDASGDPWGTKDGHLFEVLGRLKDVNEGVPDLVTHSVSRSPRWFLDEGVSIGNWQVKGADAAGLASLSVKLEFSSEFSIACFLSSYSERQMDNLPAIGVALAELYRKPGKDWKLDRKWVYTALQVHSGFIVMSLKKNTAVTLSGRGTVNVSGVPVKLELNGFVSSASSSAEVQGLEGVTPFVKLCEVYDSAFSKANWRQIG
jgi:hypothetical protein